MKVAVSIPDGVFGDAERVARQLNVSRSKLYARALAEFIDRSAADRVTAAINAVVDEVGAEPDAFAKAAARRALERVEW